MWISRGTGITGVVFGAMFSALGVYSFLDGWGAGIVFILVGIGLAVASIYAANNKIQVNINKQERKLYVYKQVFGRRSLKHEIKINSPDQFSIKEWGVAEGTGNPNGMYTLVFVSEVETIKLSSMIEGKRAATVMCDKIVEQLFPAIAKRLAA